jgi:hypothetical protein
MLITMAFLEIETTPPQYNQDVFDGLHLGTYRNKPATIIRHGELGQYRIQATPSGKVTISIYSLDSDMDMVGPKAQITGQLPDMSEVSRMDFFVGEPNTAVFARLYGSNINSMNLEIYHQVQ